MAAVVLDWHHTVEACGKTAGKDMLRRVVDERQRMRRTRRAAPNTRCGFLTLPLVVQHAPAPLRAVARGANPGHLRLSQEDAEVVNSGTMSATCDVM